jgi:hypothetical protein
MLQKLRLAAVASAERRLRREWQTYQHPPETRMQWWWRDPGPVRTQNFRSLVQVNFYRQPRD